MNRISFCRSYFDGWQLTKQNKHIKATHFKINFKFSRSNSLAVNSLCLWTRDHEFNTYTHTLRPPHKKMLTNVVRSLAHKQLFSNFCFRWSLLDLCSSWVSHLPDEMKFGRVVGFGMNEFELSKNPRLTESRVSDLNVEPSLSGIESNSLDAVLITVSVDYLVKV